MEENKNNMIYYFMFLRLTPIAPNILVNMASGIVGVPFKIYFFGSLIGQMPFSYLYTKMGMMIEQLTKVGGI